MKSALDQTSLDQLFREAHTFNKFADQPVVEQTIRELYELLKWGPTSMNAQPGRYVFVHSAAARERLIPAMIAANAERTRKAPLTVIVAMDTQFYDHLPTQFKAYDARPMFAGNAPLADATAFRNSSLQGAYLMLAARSLGLDCGPMSGFDAAQVDAEFFPDGRWKSNFIVNMGYGLETGGHYPRGPRLGFEEVARIV